MKSIVCTQVQPGDPELLAGPVQDYGAAGQPLLLVRDGLVQRQHVEVPSLGTWLPTSQVRHLRPLHERRMEGQRVFHPVLLHVQETSRYSCPRPERRGGGAGELNPNGPITIAIRARYNILRGVVCFGAIMNMSILLRCCRML